MATNGPEGPRSNNSPSRRNFLETGIMIMAGMALNGLSLVRKDKIARAIELEEEALSVLGRFSRSQIYQEPVDFARLARYANPNNQIPDTGLNLNLTDWLWRTQTVIYDPSQPPGGARLHTRPTQPGRLLFKASGDDQETMVHRIGAEASYQGPDQFNVVLARGWIPGADGANQLASSEEEVKVLARKYLTIPPGRDWRVGTMQVMIGDKTRVSPEGVGAYFIRYERRDMQRFKLEVGPFGDFVIDMRTR